jgi:hypothetical protein
VRRYLSLILTLAIKDGRVFLADRRAAAGLELRRELTVTSSKPSTLAG